MISVSKGQVPTYLRGSDFFESLDDEGGEICIPKECFKNNSAISCTTELHHLLSTLRFWGVTAIPVELVHFVLSCGTGECDKVFKEFEGQLVYLSFLRNLSENTATCYGISDFMTYHHALDGIMNNVDPAQCCARLYCVQYVYTNGKTWNAETCKLAAENGTVGMLQWLHEHGCPWNADTCAAAAFKGRLDCLKYAHANGCPWDAKTCSFAAEKGRLDCLKYAHENNCVWDVNTCSEALANDKIECFEYARNNGCPWGVDLCSSAAARGNLELLKQLHESGCPWDITTCAGAASSNKLDCLQYAHEHGCPWDATVLYSAARAGYLTVLKYAHDNGCPWSAVTCAYAAKGRLPCLKYLHENGCPWDVKTCYYAAFLGGVDMLAYAHENGCPWDATITDVTAWFGMLDPLRYAVEHGCPCDPDICNAAARSGKLACLTYLRERGCKWNAATCAVAAAAEHDALKCLQYAHEQGCPWDATTCTNAAGRGNLDCLKYAHENGCKWDSNTCTAAVKGGHLHCLTYACEHGCQLSSGVFAHAGTAGFRNCIEYIKLHKCYPRLYFSHETVMFTTTLDASKVRCKLVYYTASRTILAHLLAPSGCPAYFDDVAYLSLLQKTIPLVCSLKGNMQRPPLMPVQTIVKCTGSDVDDGVAGYLLHSSTQDPSTGGGEGSPTCTFTAVAITIDAADVVPAWRARIYGVTDALRCTVSRVTARLSLCFRRPQRQHGPVHTGSSPSVSAGTEVFAGGPDVKRGHWFHDKCVGASASRSAESAGI